MTTNLIGVTITGADDSIPPYVLRDLSLEFPFVEWGILRSNKREGLARYPSTSWMLMLRGLVQSISPMSARPRVALHLCGHLARDAMAGIDVGNAEPLIEVSRRVQLNGFSAYTLPGLRVATMMPQVDFILQCADERALRHAMELGGRYHNVCALYDPSGGRGLRTETWYPGTFIPSAGDPSIGGAGGIGPSNVVQVLESRGRNVNDFWIDGESAFRTDDGRFDVELARLFLERAKPFVCADHANRYVRRWHLPKTVTA